MGDVVTGVPGVEREHLVEREQAPLRVAEPAGVLAVGEHPQHQHPPLVQGVQEREGHFNGRGSRLR